MYFCHSSELWRDYPELVAGVFWVEGITTDIAVGHQTATFDTIAESRLATKSEGELPEVQAWRQVFSRIGLKPTHYRCALESLLRRFKNIFELMRQVKYVRFLPGLPHDLQAQRQAIPVRAARNTYSWQTIVVSKDSVFR
jgi:hypothetical protein